MGWGALYYVKMKTARCWNVCKVTEGAMRIEIKTLAGAFVFVKLRKQRRGNKKRPHADIVMAICPEPFFFLCVRPTCLETDQWYSCLLTRDWPDPRRAFDLTRLRKYSPFFRMFRRNQYALLTHYRFAAVCLLQRNARFTGIIPWWVMRFGTVYCFAGVCLLQRKCRKNEKTVGRKHVFRPTA